MCDDNKSGGWTAVINSAKTPLGFFTLAALIPDAVLISTSALASKVQMWALLVLLGLIIVLVFVIVVSKPLSLYHPKDWPHVPQRFVEIAYLGTQQFPKLSIVLNNQHTLAYRVPKCLLYNTIREKSGVEVANLMTVNTPVSKPWIPCARTWILILLSLWEKLLPETITASFP